MASEFSKLQFVEYSGLMAMANNFQNQANK